MQIPLGAFMALIFPGPFAGVSHWRFEISYHFSWSRTAIR